MPAPLSFLGAPALLLHDNATMIQPSPVDPPLVRAAAPLERAIRRYDRLSRVYDWSASFGAAVGARALSLADPRPGERVVEIGVGTGRDLPPLRERIGPAGRLVGIDLSAGMLREARARLRAGALRDVVLQRADARALPLATAWADLLFCSRVLDLVDTASIVAILEECRRVVRPGGRLVLVHMSKPDTSRSWFERLYTARLGIGGGLFVSRPVVAEPFLAALGFEVLERVYVRSLPVGSEVVLARRPA